MNKSATQAHRSIQQAESGVDIANIKQLNG